MLEPAGLGPPPAWVKATCCAQFFVPAHAVRRHPRQLYVALHSWLMNTTYPEDQASRVYEFLWHVLFSPDAAPILCPPEDECACTLYGACTGLSDGAAAS